MREIGAVLRHPGLWIEAARLAAASVRRGWWRNAPHLPLLDGEYLAWRTMTAYGSAGADVEHEDLAAYLRWRRRQRRMGRRPDG